MDGNRFDELTRAVAGSRRGLLRGLAAAAGAAALGRFGLREAEAACRAYGRACTGPTQCCSGACSGGACTCADGTSPCQKRPGKTVCVASCPPGQSLSSDCRCLCIGTGRPPRNGLCECSANGASCL